MPQLAQDILGKLGIIRGELGLTLVTAAEMERLNRRHMGAQGPTDVLSFPIDTGSNDSAGGDEPVMLGDIVICPELARKQAEDLGNTESEELCLLVLHGVLHIAGYDHETDKGQMDTLQKRLFDELCRE
ncbi:MAG: rRNA maturation RNase YbeY [Thermoleophilia bacterium]|nr:rRNA maturation RNase YbeY [Thermoleophilia bacterium]